MPFERLTARVSLFKAGKNNLLRKIIPAIVNIMAQ
jgi:hypothetical protein